MATELKGEDLLREMIESQIPQRRFWRERYRDQLTYDAFHGKVWRAGQHIKDQSHLFRHDIGRPLHLTGDWMIVGDVQLPTTDYDFAILPAAVAKKHLSKPRQLLIAGDLLNLDCFSAYEIEIGLPGFRQEVDAARALLQEWFTVFDRIIWTPGNHERRISKRNNGAILMEDLISIINTHIETSNWDHVVIDTPTGDWMIPHGSDYSVNQLTVGDMLVQKNRMHVISHHQHHMALGWDRFKHNVVIDNGGLFNQWFMSYVMLNTSKRPNMQNGFTMLRDGYPYIFSKEPMTNWDMWVGKQAVRLPKSNVIELDKDIFSEKRDVA